MNKWEFEVVVSTYLVAFILVFGVSRIDNIDERWRRISTHKWKSSLAFVSSVVSAAVLLTYTILQNEVEDYKEMMATIAFLFAVGLPLGRVFREFQIYVVARRFALIVSGLPDLRPKRSALVELNLEQISPHRRRAMLYLKTDSTFRLDDCYSSSNFFDNDGPRSGWLAVVRHFWMSSKWNWLDLKWLWRTFWHDEQADRHVHELGRLARWVKFGFPFGLRKPKSKKRICETAQNSVSLVLNAIGDHEGQSRIGAEQEADGVARLAWMYGNIMGSPDESATHGLKLLHFACLVRTAFSALLHFDCASSSDEMSEIDTLQWLNLFDCEASDFAKSLADVSCFSIGGLPFSSESFRKTTTLNLGAYKRQNSTLSPEIHARAFQKLPREMGLHANHLFHRWEQTAYFMSSTLELHAFKIAMLGVEPEEEVKGICKWIKDICEYAGVAYAVHKLNNGKGGFVSHTASEFDAFYKHSAELLLSTFFSVPSWDWHEITVHCATLAVLLTDAARPSDSLALWNYGSQHPGGYGQASIAEQTDRIEKEATAAAKALKRIIVGTVAVVRSGALL